MWQHGEAIVFVADAYRGVRSLINASAGKPTDGGSFEYDVCNAVGVQLNGDILYVRDTGFGVIRLNSKATPLSMTGFYGLILPVPAKLPDFIHRGYDDYGGYNELSMLYTLGLIDVWPDYDQSIYSSMTNKEFAAFYLRLGVTLPKIDAKAAALPVSWEDAIKNAITLAGLTSGSNLRDSGKKLGLTFKLDMSKKNPSNKDVYRITARALMLNTPVTEKSPTAKKLASVKKFGNAQIVFDVKIKGNYAYAGVESGFAVFDIKDPSNPSLAAIYPVDGSCDYVCINDDYAYVTNFGLGSILIFDISSPTIPKLVGYYRTDTSQSSLGAYRDIVCRDNTLYLPDENGLEIVDCSDPYQLKFVSYIHTREGVTCSLTLSGNYAYIGGEFAGVIRVDIRDRQHPVIFDGEKAELGMVNFTAVDGNKLYVPSSNGMLTVFSIQTDGSLKTLYTVGQGMDFNITDVDNGIVCTLGNRITAFRLSGDAPPVQTGIINGIETFVTRGDLKNGVLALASHGGLYIAKVNNGDSADKTSVIPSGSKTPQGT